MDPSLHFQSSVYSQQLFQENPVKSSDSSPKTASTDQSSSSSPLLAKISMLNPSKIALADKVKEKVQSFLGRASEAPVLSSQEQEQKAVIKQAYQELCKCEKDMQGMQLEIDKLSVSGLHPDIVGSFKQKLAQAQENYGQLKDQIMDLKAKVGGTRVMTSIRLENKNSSNSDDLKHLSDFDAVSYRISKAITRERIAYSFDESKAEKFINEGCKNLKNAYFHQSATLETKAGLIKELTDLIRNNSNPQTEKGKQALAMAKSTHAELSQDLKGLEAKQAAKKSKTSSQETAKPKQAEEYIPTPEDKAKADKARADYDANQKRIADEKRAAYGPTLTSKMQAPKKLSDQK